MTKSIPQIILIGYDIRISEDQRIFPSQYLHLLFKPTALKEEWTNEKDLEHLHEEKIEKIEKMPAFR